jgi:hypothetical protein
MLKLLHDDDPFFSFSFFPLSSSFALVVVLGEFETECVFHGSWRHREIVFAAIHGAHTDTKIFQ